MSEQQLRGHLFEAADGLVFDPPPPSFRKCFGGMNHGELAALWRDFKKYNELHMMDHAALYKENLLKNREAAEKEFNAWPNPLANAKKGQPYSCSFTLPESIAFYVISGLEQLGMQYVKDEKTRQCKITGVPNQAGEFKIIFRCGWDGFKELYQLLKTNPHNPLLYFERELTITITPDPRELWKDIPTDPENTEYYKPDLDSQDLACGDRRLLAASRRGRSHAHSGLPRDDDFGLGCVNGWSILAVADGAGSAQFSRQGSRLACKTAVNFCVEHLAPDNTLDGFLGRLTSSSIPSVWKAEALKIAWNILPNAFLAAYKEIREEARNNGYDPKLYATTLLMCICKKFPAGWIVLSFQVGDGAMAMFHDNKIDLLAEPDEGEYGGQTRFITMRDIFDSSGDLMRRLRVDLAEDLEALILMSDGVSDAKFSTLANLRNPEIWRRLMDELAPALDKPDTKERLLEWLNFWSQGNHDDRTVALLLPQSSVDTTIANINKKKIQFLPSLASPKIPGIRS